MQSVSSALLMPTLVCVRGDEVRGSHSDFNTQQIFDRITVKALHCKKCLYLHMREIMRTINNYAHKYIYIYLYASTGLAVFLLGWWEAGP